MDEGHHLSTGWGGSINIVRRKEYAAYLNGWCSKALGVSLDFLVGNIDLELSDKLMNRITEVSKMTEKDKDHVFTLLDAFIARTKLQGFV